MICLAASAAGANSGIKTTARATAIVSLRMRLSSLRWGAVEDSLLPMAPVDAANAIGGGGRAQPPESHYVSNPISTLITGVRGRGVLRTSPRRSSQKFG